MYMHLFVCKHSTHVQFVIVSAGKQWTKTIRNCKIFVGRLERMGDGEKEARRSQTQDKEHWFSNMGLEDLCVRRQMVSHF